MVKVFATVLEPLEQYQGLGFTGALVRLPVGECPPRMATLLRDHAGTLPVTFEYRSREGLVARVRAGESAMNSDAHTTSSGTGTAAPRAAGVLPSCGLSAWRRRALDGPGQPGGVALGPGLHPELDEEPGPGADPWLTESKQESQNLFVSVG